jgi:ketosteroid isomerase-like protein
MTAQQTIDLMRAYVEAIDEEALERLESLLAPEVAFYAPPHTIRFPGNVIARLRIERDAFPDQRLEVENAFADEDGTQGAILVRWTGRRMTARICIVIEAQDGKIVRIETYGGLIKTMFDVGLLRVA